MTLYEIVEEVNEKTHLGLEEVLDFVRSNWPHASDFKPVQVRLAVQLIEKRRSEWERQRLAVSS